MQPAARRRNRAVLTIAVMGILVVIANVILSLSWTTPMSVNVLVLAVGLVIGLALTAVAASIVYERAGR